MIRSAKWVASQSSEPPNPRFSTGWPVKSCERFPARDGRGAGKHKAAPGRRIGRVHFFIGGNLLFPNGKIVICFRAPSIVLRRNQEPRGQRQPNNGFHTRRIAGALAKEKKFEVGVLLRPVNTANPQGSH